MNLQNSFRLLETCKFWLSSTGRCKVLQNTKGLHQFTSQIRKPAPRISQMQNHGRRLSQIFRCKTTKTVILCLRTENGSFNKFNIRNYSSGKVPSLSTSQVKKLLALAKPEKWKLTGAILLLIVSSAVTMVVPFALGKVIDIIYTGDATEMKQNLNKLSYILIGVFILGAICNFGRVYLMSIAGQRITNRLRRNVFSAIINQEVAFFDKNKTGELVNRLSSDSQLVSQTLTQNISDGLRSTIMVTAGISMMVYMSPELAAVGLSIVPAVAALAVVYGRFVRNITKQVQDSLADATQVAEERISNIRTVKSFSKEDMETSAYSSKLQHVLELAYKESLARGVFFGMTGLSGNIIVLTVLYYGGVMVGESTITVGNLSSFLLYAAYIGVSIGGLSSFYSELNRGLGASARLFEIVERQPRISSNTGLIFPEVPRGSILLDNITFSYPSRSDTPILNGLSLEIPAASMTALVGASGSGKSTIASILLRLYDPDSGRILLDGNDITKLNPQWLRSHVGYVSQEPILFSCSIRDNILYGANDVGSVTEDELISVAKEANCYDFITKTFPQGFDTLVGERGVMLSGGQKQRIAIARALIKNPRILLLDEATSALDAESEHLVQEALERIMKERTVLTIAHRLSTVKRADQIAVLEKGHVVETGKYSELVSKPDGVFRKLIQHQTFMTE